MQITITGGFGFVGSHCADFFRKNGHEVTIIARNVPPELQNWSRDFRVILGNVTDKTLEIGGDIVIHCAALNETKNATEEEFMRTNAQGTQNTIESAISNSAGKFVKISTFHVYGKSSGIINENTETEPKSLYAKSSLAGDTICLDYSKEINVSILRFSNLYGPPIHTSIDRWTLAINNFCLQAVKDGSIKLKTQGNQKRDFVSTSNAMNALKIVSAYKKTGEIFNAGGSNVLSVREAADRVASNFEILYGKKIPVITGSIEEKSDDFQYAIDKINAIGYSPRKDMDRTIKEILAVCDRV